MSDSMVARDIKATGEALFIPEEISGAS